MKYPSSYLKMRVLGAIESAPGKTQEQRVKSVADMIFIDEDGNKRQFTWRTIYTWFYRYKNYGITGINPATRKDKGSTRKVSPEQLLEAINQVKPYFRNAHFNKMELYRKAIELGLLRREEISQTSFYRFIREYDLLKDDFKTPRRLAFAMQYANQLWQADTMFGPYLKDDSGKMRQAKLIAFIDDASRLICHGQFFFTENTASLISALRTALYKRGVPEQLYVDNGAVYSSQEITLICARIGCILRHTPVRDGSAKGKIERFFRTVRSCFLCRNLDLRSLEILNKQFTAWVEDEYNHKTHSSLGMKPIDRFGLDRNRINFLPNLHANDDLFFAEQERTVLNNNTFSFRSAIYEAPVMLQNKRIKIRFDRNDKNAAPIVYYKNERLGPAVPLDLIANGLLKRSSKEDLK